MNELATHAPRLGASSRALSLAAPLVASLSLAACLSTGPSTEAGVAEVQLPEAERAERAQVPSAEPRARPLRGGPEASYSLGELASPPVGAACPESSVEGRLELCGTLGRVAVQHLVGQPHVTVTEVPPCAPQTMRSSGVYLVSACIVDRHLYLREVCIACRLPNVGSTIYARLDELSPRQHAEIGKLFRADAQTKTPSTSAEWGPFLAAMAKPDGAPGP